MAAQRERGESEAGVRREVGRYGPHQFRAAHKLLGWGAVRLSARTKLPAAAPGRSRELLAALHMLFGARAL